MIGKIILAVTFVFTIAGAYWNLQAEINEVKTENTYHKKRDLELKEELKSMNKKLDIIHDGLVLRKIIPPRTN